MSPGPPQLAPVLGGLLVGGASRRMGRAKALIEIGGVSLAERAAAALAPHVERVVLLGAGPIPAALDRLERLADVPIGGRPGDGAGGGPLAGLRAAFAAEPAAAWLLCPCDLPALRPEAVAWLIAQRRPGRRAVLARRQAGEPPEPLLALYEPAIAAAVEELAARGERAPRRLAELAGVAVLVPPAHLADCWRDADRPEDLPAGG